MIERLQIDGFRGLDGIQIDALGQFNVIVGPGGSGKTSLLEAIFLFCSSGDPDLLRRILDFRRLAASGLSAKGVCDMLDWSWSVGRDPQSCEIGGTWSGTERRTSFRHIEHTRSIPLRDPSGEAGHDERTDTFEGTLATFEAKTVSGGETYVGKLTVTPNKIEAQSSKIPNISARYIGPAEAGLSGPLAPLWSQVEDHLEEEKVGDLLKSLDDGIRGVRIAADELNRAWVRVDHTSLGRTPIEFLGAGFGKALAIACNTIAAENGILIIDEFDTALHTGAQPRIIRFAMEAAIRHNVQLFVSTHSLETLDAFLEQYESTGRMLSQPDDLRVIQMKRRDNRTEVQTLDAERAKCLREEIGFDLRRAT